MTFAAEHDVVVLGAGPAGTSAAIRLAQMGLDVGIVERSPFPRSHVGICISDETVALIAYLGLGDEFDNARFWRRNLTAVRWGDAESRFVPQNGYHVDRAVLDWLMVCRSRSRSESLPAGPGRGGETAGGLGLGDNDRFGRAAPAPEGAVYRRRGRETSGDPGCAHQGWPSADSVHANWALGAMADFDGLIEAGEDAWLWYAQTARDRAVVSVFCDPRRLRTSKQGGMQAKYSGLLRQFRALKLEQLGRQCSDPQACDAPVITPRIPSGIITSGLGIHVSAWIHCPRRACIWHCSRVCRAQSSSTPY